MKLSLVPLLVLLMFSSYAETIVTGEEAKSLYQNVQGYEYSAGAKTAGIEYRLTIRHNESISCEKEETIYTTQSTILYTCIIK